MHWIERAYLNIFCYHGSQYLKWIHPRSCKNCALVKVIPLPKTFDVDRRCLRSGHDEKVSYFDLQPLERAGCFSFMARITDLLPLYQRMLPYPIFEISEKEQKSEKAGKKRGKKNGITHPDKCDTGDGTNPIPHTPRRNKQRTIASERIDPQIPEGQRVSS
jgi:hypothetical protein